MAATITLVAWFPIALLIVARLPLRIGLLTCFIIGWLFLPNAAINLDGLPSYNKTSATCTAALIGMLLFKGAEIPFVRLEWHDVPFIIWCTVPFATSISNGLGAYEGVTGVMHQTILWGVPYFIGRLSMVGAVAMRELALAIIVGGILYVPLCLLEIRFSPQLHTWVYGYHQHSISQAFRFGGWRPTVFLEHGLMVALWMTNAAVISMWMYLSGNLKKYGQRTVLCVVVSLYATALMCKSAGAILLLASGTVALLSCYWTGRKWAVGFLIAICAVYPVIRASGLWDAASVVSWVAEYDEDKAESLQVRLVSEEVVSKRVAARPLLGWGGWSRSYQDDEGNRLVWGADSLWVIAYGCNGAVGLASVMAALLLPSAVVLFKVPAKGYLLPGFAPAVGLAMIVLLFAIDCLMNGMINPLFLVVAGALNNWSREYALALHSRIGRDRCITGSLRSR